MKSLTSITAGGLWKWDDPVFSPAELAEVAGIGVEALKKYIQRGTIFTESRYITKQGKARRYSLEDVCQARAMGLLLNVHGMSPDAARRIAWGISDAMRELAEAHSQDREIDMSLLVVRWPTPTGVGETYGSHGIKGEELATFVSDIVWPPQFGMFCITRQQLSSEVVVPCLDFLKYKQKEGTSR